MEEDILPPEAGEEGVAAPEIEQEAEQGAQQERQPISVEELATDMGWTPQEKWRGDPEKWKPADEFVRKTVDVNKGLGERLKGLETQISTMARTSAELTERAVAKERDRLLAERNEAFELGDQEAFNKAERELQTLPAVKPEPPETISFKERNASWFNKDEEATAWAINRAGQLGQQGIISPARQLAIVEREARELFPEYFEEAPKPKAAPLNKPGNRGATPQAKGYSSLPKEVQDAAVDYEKRGVCSREEYARIYYEQGGA